jgi:hypothetical protein
MTSIAPEPTTPRKVVFTVLTVLLPVVVLAACVLLLMLIGHDPQSETDAGAGPSGVYPDDPAAPGQPAGPAGPSPSTGPAPPANPAADPDAIRRQALEAMAQRYRTGPFVRLLAMQPSSVVQGGAMAWMSRAGRTVDNPWLVERGQLRADRAPSSTGSAATVSLHPDELGQPTVTVVPGVPNRVRLQVSLPPDAIAGLHVAFEGYFGHFFVPAQGQGADGEVGSIYVTEPDVTAVTFGIDAAVLPDGRPIPGPAPHPVTMYIGVEDRDGNISSYVTRQLQVVPVGSGDLEVTLTMSVATDLDLYVVEPTGVVVYYRNTSSFTGGHLDLDANAACQNNVGINNEHVFWPRGAAPAGTYTVRVANYTSCIGGAQVDYQVTVRNCGEVAVYTGSFAGDGRRDQCTASPGQDPSWCHDVVSFMVMPCQR